MNADGYEQREAERLEREQERLDAEDLAQQLADESRDNPPLTESEVMGSPIVLKMQRDALADTLRDIALGAQMMLEPALAADGMFKRYAEEVLRVARAGIKQAGL